MRSTTTITVSTDLSILNLPAIISLTQTTDIRDVESDINLRIIENTG